jgi:hypothetical protein
VPTASETHFFVKLAFAAPASFFSAAAVLQAFAASASHFFKKLVCAAPANFFSAACALQLGPWANALEANMENKTTRVTRVMGFSSAMRECGMITCQ